MRKDKKLLFVAVAMACCLLIAWLATSIHGRERTYEVRPEITLPEYRTDTARAIDTYERIMERFMDIIEQHLTGINSNFNDFGKKLDSIDKKLTKLSKKITRIEKALGIKQPKIPTRTNPQSKQTQKKAAKTNQP